MGNVVRMGRGNLLEMLRLEGGGEGREHRSASSHCFEMVGMLAFDLPAQQVAEDVFQTPRHHLPL